MCLDHVGQLTRSNPRRTKRGGEHHIATGHGPMVQGGLLTTHPGSVHGGGEAPGGGSPLRQGAGKSSPGAPDLGSAAAAEQRRDRKKGFRPRGFRDVSNIYMQKGVTRGGGGAPGAPLVRPGVGPRRVAAWANLGSPLALL